MKMPKYWCIRCDKGTDKYIITVDNVGPLCEKCFELYCNPNTHAEYLRGFLIHGSASKANEEMN